MATRRTFIIRSMFRVKDRKTSEPFLEHGACLDLWHPLFDNHFELNPLAMILVDDERLLLFDGGGDHLRGYVVDRQVAGLARLEIAAEDQFGFGVDAAVLIRGGLFGFAGVAGKL